ncbi:MAG: hypothetical protein JW807_01330 [Spirochaetes bacterium]|nr:hypothetical protein [Spirochaetota bacterium]
MTFIILAVLTFLIVVVFIKQKSVASVCITIALLIAMTTAVLLLGADALSGRRALVFFNSAIDAQTFYRLMAAWYGADIFCAVLVIRNYIEYRKVNAKK